MSKRAAATLSALILLAAPGVAQTPGQSWQPEDRLSRLLKVESTDGVLVDCHDGWSESCFRVVLRISPATSRTVDVGHIPVDRERGGTAFTSTGAACKEIGARGLPDPRSWSSGTYTWGEAPYRVTPERSATLLVQFGCDGKLAPGDQATIQFALAVDPEGREILTARYAASGLNLKKMPGMQNSR
jgi:hypothetical protein